MAALGIVEIRKGLADAIERVAESKERMVITRRNRPVAALVPLDDAALLEKLEGRPRPSRSSASLGRLRVDRWSQPPSTQGGPCSLTTGENSPHRSRLVNRS